MSHDAEEEPRRRRWHRRRLRIAVYLLLCGLAYIGLSHRRWLWNNFGVVDPGQVYRSAQPVNELPRLIAERHFESILNLRGGSVTDSWYRNEVELSAENGIDFYDFPMSAERRPTRRELLILLDLMDRCRYPLLIHCKSGADRTGLASALYLLYVKGRSPSKAMEAFSVLYGHVPIHYLSSTSHLHEPFHEYEAWLARANLPHTPQRFRDWVRNDYVSDGPLGPVRSLRPGPRESLAGRINLPLSR